MDKSGENNMSKRTKSHSSSLSEAQIIKQNHEKKLDYLNKNQPTQQECLCHCHHKMVYDKGGNLLSNDDCLKDSPEPTICEHCTQQKDRSFFDFTDEEKQEVVNKAADEANKAQRELVESVTQQKSNIGKTQAIHRQVAHVQREDAGKDINVPTSQQKDAGMTKEQLEYILFRQIGIKAYPAEVDILLMYINQHGKQVATQARQQTIQECLEAVGENDKYPENAIKRKEEEMMIVDLLNGLRIEIRANIEKLMNKNGKP